ncbi:MULTISPECIES: hypothetical protein [Cetobacterium]|uniref:Uncharacterized protein n=1 Tax=Candidatus Cetobacterium colombiensis TaxID=3073100 RepID=A0ABU4W8T2_9FUSO|nr:hypothetical protein [Candidatus Cetobacterium colombiensis]MDX8335570.1 hypothetical protein [Candidatus Cetobacterium colombiensis]
MLEKKRTNNNSLIDYSAKFYLFPLLLIGLILRNLDSFFIKLKYQR